MLKQILAKLEAKFPGLPKSFLGLIAAQLAAKVTEESGIDQAITDYDNAAPIQQLATEFQKEGDRRVNDAKKEWEKKNPPKNDPADPPADPKKDDPNEPAWLKTLTGQMTSLANQVATLTKEKQTTSMQSRLAEKLKDKVPASYYKGRALPEKDEDLDAHVAQIEADWTEFRQEQINAGFMSETPPVGGFDKGGVPNTKLLDDQIKNWAKGKEEPEKSTK